ncbi:MAG TPA: hypothetical protein VFD27_10550 [Chthoniobacteraceae bacterium]|nr:hypothetical protein [Chthoniobacteraceae bacterium]
MFTRDLSKNSIEVLEARIAPASAVASGRFVAAITGSPILLHAGDVLTTGGKVTIPGVGDVGSGAYLLYVEQGDALIFTTDHNNNRVVDFNEITGIAAGNGLRITCFTDIYGDIVTNLNANTTLSDSNNFAGDDDPLLKGDGRVVLNNTIEKIEMRSLTLDDVVDENGDGDTTAEVLARLVLTSYSIHGNVYAGKQFGVTLPGGAADTNNGLIIDDAGRAFQQVAFNTAIGPDFYDDNTRLITPTVGFIRTGSAVSGEWFTFGISSKHDVQGYLANFSAPSGQVGGDIASVRTNDPMTAFDIAGLIAGNGGIGARGGNIIAATLHGDTTAGYIIMAGNGGRGPTGGAGGSILDFQDLSGVNDLTAGTGQVIIQSGDGGDASTGAGGNGGVIKFGTMTVNGGLAINLGSGGDGFVAGGNGASLANAEIVTPEGKVQFGSNNIGTTHVLPLVLRPDGFPVTGKLDAGAYGVIGRHFGVDFDHDGAGDAVTTSTDPNEVTVVFGDPSFPGFVRTELTADPDLLPGRFFRIALDAPINPEAVTVADFNHDGFPDIAVGSNNPGNFGGVFVFLAKTEDTNDDGVLSDAEDLDHDHVVDFLGFRTARQSVLPALNTFDPDDPNLTVIFGDYKRSAVPIVDLEAGDFDGDGITDLAVLATYLLPAPSRNPQVNPNQIIMFLHPDMENGRPTGQFYADFGTQRIIEPPQGANPFIPFIDIGGETAGVIQATALTDTGGPVAPGLAADAPHDIIVGTTIGRDHVFIVDNSVPSRLGPIGGPNTAGDVTWGFVDTDRLIGGGHYAPVRPTVRDFAVVDAIGEPFTDSNANGVYDLGEPFFDRNTNGVYNAQDGFADFVFISENPLGFMVALGSSNAFTFFDFDVMNLSMDNGGAFFGGPPGGFDVGTNVMAIRDANTDGTGLFADDVNDNVAVLVYPSGPRFGAPDPFVVMEFDIVDQPPPDIQNNPGAVELDFFIEGFFVFGGDTSVVAFDTYYPITADSTLVSYAVALPTKSPLPDHIIEIVGDLELLPDFYEISLHSINITAGNGGGGLVGKGGAGGFLGGGLTLTTTTDPNTGLSTTDLKGSLSIVLPANLAFEGEVTISAGDGGNGFSDGGIGGNITGTTVRFSPQRQGAFSTTVFAGDGGFGVGGKGGDGGNLRSNSFDQGFQLTAGMGGRGRVGGTGGEIIGNGFAGFYDSNARTQELIAGTGGNGVKAGGNGGDIRDFHGDHSGRVTGSPIGTLAYTAGSGGDAGSGPGGHGGDILDSSPLADAAFLGGDIYLAAGFGGNGVTGGNGGSVQTFRYKTSGSVNPAIASVLAGDGGKGISGDGGRGGNVIDIQLPTVGGPNTFNAPFPTPVTGGGRPTPYEYNRYIGGNGGDSAGRNGGAGGSVERVENVTSGGPFALVGGAGGKGLYAGGGGGSVLVASISVGGASASKSLIVAGEGGAATAFIANPNDAGVRDQAEKAFGGRIGAGGNGGTIENYQQLGAIGARVDLIAGNGGDTLNYGVTSDSGLPVGIGGSVRNVFVSGSIGNIQPNIAIRSYNDLLQDESMADFVNANLRDPLVPGDFTDSTGLVGLVVGGSGRLKEVQVGYDNANNADFRSNPAFRGINGDAMNIEARNIMAMVAGSVVRIASIEHIANIVVTANGALGVDKTNDPAPYRDKDDNPLIEPVLDGRLVDGAIIYKVSIGPPPNSEFVFQLGG